MIYDVIGIGFGPANIALAIAMEEEGFQGTRLFLERQQGPGWQEDMLLEGSDIQNHPLRDLVTPANPCSRYSFTNFLHVHGRLFEFLNLGVPFALRQEYAQYVRWAARAFSPSVRYGVHVEQICIVNGDADHGRPCFAVTTACGTYHAHSIVVAPGRSPQIPPAFMRLLGARVFHLTEYKSRIEALAPQLEKGGAIAVVGASQSGVEILLDLDRRFARAEIHSVIRSYGFRLKDTSPFSDEIYFPQFVEDYFHASPPSKSRLNDELRFTNYSSVDEDVLQRLYMLRYQHRLDGAERLLIHSNTDIVAAEASGTGIRLALSNHLGQGPSCLQVDAVVLATGFKNFGRGGKEELIHPLLRGVSDHLEVDPQLGVAVNRDYSARYRGGQPLPPLFLNGLCESTHGFGDAGSFSLLSLRARDIVASLRGRVPAVQAGETCHG